MANLLKRLLEAFTKQPVGHAYPNAKIVAETALIPLADVMKLYERDPTCKACVDLLSSVIGMGFFTTVNEEYERAEEAKKVVDEFNENVNLDALLCDMARVLIACGNDFWLKITPERLTELHRLPVDAIEKIEQSYIEGLKIPWRVEGYKLRQPYKGDGDTLRPEAVIHWRINCIGQSTLSGVNCFGQSQWGTGILQVLLHTLTINSDKRPPLAWAKSKIEKVIPNIFSKYAAHYVIVQLEGQKEETLKKLEAAIKSAPEEGAWIFSSARNVSVNPVAIDPRSRFESYIEHIINQFYLGCETPLPRLFSTPGFTEASAKAALELQNMLVKPIQRYIKRQVERNIFDVVLVQAGFDPVKAKVRLNWGTPEVPEIRLEDMLKAAELGLIRAEEFRKNAIKWGWELWEKEAETGEGDKLT